MNPRYLIMMCRVVLGVIFLLACVEKILFPHDFAMAIFRYRLLPHSTINLAAITLPWMELTAAIAIIFSCRFRDAAAALIFGMLLAFTLGIAINLIRGLEIACGCTTTAPTEDLISWGHVLRNLGYMFLALVVLKEDWLIHRLHPRRRPA